MKNFPFCVVIILSILCVIDLSCFSGQMDYWYLEWQFKNVADSTATIKFPMHSINVQSQYHSGIMHDSLYSDGHFVAEIIIKGSSDVLDDFPKTASIHFKLWYPTQVVFDSILTFDELDFKKGYTSIYNGTVAHLSNKTFYIKVP